MARRYRRSDRHGLVRYSAVEDPLALAQQAAAELHRRTGFDRFDVAVVLGSGWQGAAERLGEPTAELGTTELPGFVASGVEGHTGRILAFDRDGQSVLAFLGRTHLYEGHGVAAVSHGVRTAVAAGARTIVLTNACGAIHADLTPGEPVLIRDHISLTAVSPLVGGQFVDLGDLYAARLRTLARVVDPSLAESVYAHWPGPAFETPAEIRMLRTLGADLVGMSTVPEAIAAHALGAEVLALSLPTNWAAGMTEQRLSHQEVIEMGETAAPRCAALLSGILDRL
jgi:purine-nucleoside phosphorylase